MEHLQREDDNSMQSKSSRVMMWAENNKAARYGVVQALGSPNCISLPQMTDIELGFNVALLGFDLALVQSFLAILLFLPFINMNVLCVECLFPSRWHCLWRWWKLQEV
jgi:hypothetical protein